MTLKAVLFSLTCDGCGDEYGTSAQSLRLEQSAVRSGWMLNRKKNGEVARRAGTDRCPDCIPPEWRQHR